MDKEAWDGLDKQFKEFVVTLDNLEVKMSSVKEEDIELTSLMDEDPVPQSEMPNEAVMETISVTVIGNQNDDINAKTELQEVDVPQSGMSNEDDIKTTSVTDQNDDITVNTELLEIAEQPELQTDNQAWFSLPRLLQLLTVSNMMFFVLDVCLPVTDIAMDIKVTYNYWSRSNFTWNGTSVEATSVHGVNEKYFILFGVEQVYSVGFIVSVIILILPSLSLMVDLVVKKEYSPAKLLKALLYPLQMVFEGVNCFLNPGNEEKRNKFQISKEHEILLEATLQIFVQFGILLFELLDSKTKKSLSRLNTVLIEYYGCCYIRYMSVWVLRMICKVALVVGTQFVLQDVLLLFTYFAENTIQHASTVLLFVPNRDTFSAGLKEIRLTK